MVELFNPQGNEGQTPAASKKDGLYLRKPLNANIDRPLMQIDRANQWSDYAEIPNAPKVKDQTVLIKGLGE